MLRRVLLGLATSERLEWLVRGLPGGERAALRLVRRYVGGLEPDDAIARAHRLAAERLASSIDFFGESVSDPAEADRVAEAYIELASALTRAPSGTFLSVDLSHLGVDEPGDAARWRLERIVERLPPGAVLQVGAEQAARAERIVATVVALGRAGAAVAATVQANLRRSPADAERLAQAGVPIRLVKGAYAEAPAVALRWGEPTDLAFLSLAHALHRGGATVWLGTHDPVLREALLHALPRVGVEMLLGVRSGDAGTLAARGVPVRIYVPYGENWFRYAMRRLAESRRF